MGSSSSKDAALWQTWLWPQGRQGLRKTVRAKDDEFVVIESAGWPFP